MYYRSRRIASGLLALALAALLSLTAGCSKTSSQPDVIVIVPSATANEPDPMLAPSDQALLYDAALHSSAAMAYIVDPATDQPTTVSLTPKRSDGQVEYGPQRNDLISQNVTRVMRLVAAQAATESCDQLNLIAAAVRVTSGPGTLLVVSSGLSTAGGFELQTVGWDANADSVAAQLKNRGLLPNLQNWTVVFSGLGDSAGRQPALPLPQRTTLIDYWLAICRAAGAAQCRTDETTRPDPPSRSSTPVPIVPVPLVTPVLGPKGSSGLSVPADELFAFNSASLLPGADLILQPLVAGAQRGYRLVSITGYASPDGGSDAYNTALSLARARSVQERLETLGLPASQITSVVGAGTAGKSARACYRNGQLDEAVCGQLRRVVVLLRSPTVASS
jgi:outer membrane protein OmpA-like peptidoglycan-associated protein